MLTHTVSFVTLSELIAGTDADGSSFFEDLADSGQFTWGDSAHSLERLDTIAEYVDSEIYPILFEKIQGLPRFLFVDLEN